MRDSCFAGICVTGAFVLSACAMNPATGKRELMLVSEDQEIALGKQANDEAAAAYGIYEDAALAAYVASLGQQIAQRSERPQLPWTFRIVDDASVNAFALPGGFIYVTRGLLTHLDSEAELVMVMGHEVGHVTARHSANQISKQQLATLGLGIGMIAAPSLQRFAGLGQAGLGLLFLKFGRDDERQADELGLRYSDRLGYDPAQSARTMDLLDRVSQQAATGRMPGWLSTHPDPGDRYRKLLAEIQQGRLAGQKVNREGYLRRLDGVTFGEDPREGFFRSDTFYHPTLDFQFRMPRGFEGQNTKQAVVAASSEGDAVLQLALASGTSAEQAARAFASETKVQSSGFRRTSVNGLPAVAGDFEAASGQTPLSGTAAFVEHRGHVFQLVGYAAASDWVRYRKPLVDAISSFGPLRERWARDARPRRLEIVTPDRDMSVSEFGRRYPSTVSESTLVLINQLQPGQTLKAGQLMKRVTGGQGLEP